MTLVRRHLVAAVGLVLALATGIALGAGPLSRAALVPTRAEAPAAPAPADTSGDDLAEEVGPLVTRDRLSGRTVAVVSTPGVAPATVGAVAASIEDASGSVAARWQVGRSLVADGETALVDTLGEQLLEQLGDGVADAEAPPYERMGQLLGTAVSTRGGQAVGAGADVLTVRQSIDAASLLSSDTPDARRAPLVVLVLGDDVEDAIVEGLVTGLAARSSRVVVAAEERPGDLAVVEDEALATTVDGIGGATGRLAAVLALAAPEDTPVGSYGASGSDGTLPLR